jgi:hypothetical protein
MTSLHSILCLLCSVLCLLWSFPFSLGKAATTDEMLRCTARPECVGSDSQSLQFHNYKADEVSSKHNTLQDYSPWNENCSPNL